MSSTFSRRNFIRKSAITAGAASMAPLAMANSEKTDVHRGEALPREVWIASISQMDIKEDSAELMIKRMLRILENVKVYNPDIVCLPEVFHTSNVNKSFTVKEKLELSTIALKEMAIFSESNNCYTICPVYTTEDGNIFNAAVLFDRKGQKIGEYRKMHLTEGEIENGLTPGALSPPVFETDFGKIGVQICFDMMWDDGWKKLRENGAEIVFWPSAFAGGQIVNTKAWQHKYTVVSSTRKNTSKICDITGEIISKTGIWEKNFVCAPINLEKAFLHIWPFVKRFGAIRKKYGRKIKITEFHEEEWAIIESIDPDIRVNDILKEFELKTYEQLTKEAEAAQKLAREKL